MFLPTGNPHYKVSDMVAHKNHRFNMLCIATEGMDNIEISDYEIKSTTPCYTVDTMRYFKNNNPQNEYCFIIGADSLDYIHKWKDAKNLIAENEFVVVNRNFKSNYNIDKNIEYILSILLTFSIPAHKEPPEESISNSPGG
jgi:nicotinate-nucleotide adenylyltransferase